MRKISRVLIVMTIVAFALSLNAEPLPMRAYIPFAFLAGNETLPAGEYIVRVDEYNRVLMQSRDAARATGVPILASVYQPMSKADMGRLEFARYGDTYVLRNVWHSGSTQGNQVVISRKVKELARNHSGGEITVVGAH